MRKRSLDRIVRKRINTGILLDDHDRFLRRWDFHRHGCRNRIITDFVGIQRLPRTLVVVFVTTVSAHEPEQTACHQNQCAADDAPYARNNFQYLVDNALIAGRRRPNHGTRCRCIDSFVVSSHVVSNYLVAFAGNDLVLIRDRVIDARRFICICNHIVDWRFVNLTADIGEFLSQPGKFVVADLNQ